MFVCFFNQANSCIMNVEESMNSGNDRKLDSNNSSIVIINSVVDTMPKILVFL
jgi:hypothetical protein